MVASEHKFKTALACAPASWKYIPVVFKGGFIDGWPDLFFSVDECIARGTNYENPKTKKVTTLTVIGLPLCPITETCAVDFDGVGSPRNFEHHFGKSVKSLPPTITTTSGRLRLWRLWSVEKKLI